MPRYQYVAVDAAGAQVKGKFDAQSEAALRRDLLLQNLEVQKVKMKRSIGQIDITPQKVPLSEIMHFSRQMATFLRAGVPVTEALDTLSRDTKNQRFSTITVSGWTARWRVIQSSPASGWENGPRE